MVGISKIIYRSADLARVNNINKQYNFAHSFSRFASALLNLGKKYIPFVDNVIDISYETLCQAGDIAIRGLIIANDAIIISSDAITKTGKIVGRGLVKGGAKIIDGVKDYGNKIIDQPLAVLVDAGILTLSVFFPITCLVTAGSLAGLNVAFNFKEFTNKAGTFWKDNFTNESWENIAENTIATAVALFASGIAYGKIGGGIKEATALSKQLMYVVRNEAKVAAAFSGISKQSQKFLTPITTIFKSNVKVLQAATETGVSPFIAATEFIKDNPEILKSTKSISKTIQNVAKTRKGLGQAKITKPFKEKKILTYLKKLLSKAKRTKGIDHQVETVIEDGNKIIFRKDSHPLGGKYKGQGNIKYYNIEIHKLKGYMPTGEPIYERFYNLHLIPTKNSLIEKLGKYVGKFQSLNKVKKT